MEEKNAPAKGSIEKGDKSKTTRKEPKDSIINPDLSVLENYSPTEGAKSHPDWVKKKFPSYIEPHGEHGGPEATSVREITHNGHHIKIITTYCVEVDGKPANLHLSVDEDGQVYTHATPFVTYGSAVDLMKQVMDAYPDAFTESGPNADHGRDHNQGGGHQ
ncbi:hypothetical protein SAMN05216386_0665 [Nitrosospira briensis]|uniref:Uncharacterized protein n=1 Tax=Nitrosospira briensis TaxID=35799 RepID=A0A1I4YG36_9PROT|nr:hypothetical protein [Nitrosospira briensis]SFN36570.1 hypothetical protein SAMN05216386_0665 [Nitrosospira briensis]